MKLLISLKQSFFITLILVVTFTSAQANNRYQNFQGQGIWSFASNKQAVQVFMKNGYVYAGRPNQHAKQSLPATPLKRVNTSLLNDYTDQYIVIDDFNRDGWQDVGILKSVGFARNQSDRSSLCYAVFNYQPSFYSYKTKAAKTVCR